MHDDSRDPAAAQRRIARFAFGAMALVSILVGFAIWQFADAIGLDEYTAKLIAAVFVAVGIGDIVIFHFWDRLFKSRG